MRLSLSLLTLACSLALTGCQQDAATPAAPTVAETPAAAPEVAAVDQTTETERRLMAIIENAHRSDADRARDAFRHPVETLSFFGVTPDTKLIEITPGGGWYADILAPFLRAHGSYTAAIWDDTAEGSPEYYKRLNTSLSEKLQATPELYGAPNLLRFDTKAPVFGEPESADTVLTFRNAHNWIKNDLGPAYFAAFYSVLKPGGTLGVVDHRAADGTEYDPNSGYVTEQQIIDLATAAGFQLMARSEINANPNDTRNHPKGVWSLPPSYALGDEDRAKYEAIGESDRMTLRFSKPATM